MGGARGGPPSAFLAPATGPGAATQKLGARLIAGRSEILAADEKKECYGAWYLGTGAGTRRCRGSAPGQPFDPGPGPGGHRAARGSGSAIVFHVVDSCSAVPSRDPPLAEIIGEGRTEASRGAE